VRTNFGPRALQEPSNTQSPGLVSLVFVRRIAPRLKSSADPMRRIAKTSRRLEPQNRATMLLCPRACFTVKTKMGGMQRLEGEKTELKLSAGMAGSSAVDIHK